MNPFLATGAVMILLSSIVPTLSFAEMYIAGMAGYTMPNDLTNIEGNGVNSGISISDLEMQSSVAYGGKIGYYFPQLNWLGVETELYNTTPHVKQQSVTASGFGLSNVPFGTQPGFNVRVLTWGINAVVRYPGKVVQPYAGVGLGVFFAEAKFQGQSDSDTAPGLNALAGIRLFATDHLALFAEYKYNRASFSFKDQNVLGFDADYSANIFMGGISYHF
jgi:opacity protein-like surface antigen